MPRSPVTASVALGSTTDRLAMAESVLAEGNAELGGHRRDPGDDRRQLPGACDVSELDRRRETGSAALLGGQLRVVRQRIAQEPGDVRRRTELGGTSLGGDFRDVPRHIIAEAHRLQGEVALGDVGEVLSRLPRDASQLTAGLRCLFGREGQSAFWSRRNAFSEAVPAL